MKHISPDYDRIQDPAGIIPEDEPVFLIRGQDKSGPATLEQWAALNERNGGDPEASRITRIQAENMRQWQKNVKCKPADLPLGDEVKCPTNSQTQRKGPHGIGCLCSFKNFPKPVCEDCGVQVSHVTCRNC